MIQLRQEGLKENFKKSAEELDIHVCTRVEEAWSVGTMSGEDFILISEDPDTIYDFMDWFQGTTFKDEDALVKEIESFFEFGNHGYYVVEDVEDVYGDGTWSIDEAEEVLDSLVEKIGIERKAK